MLPLTSSAITVYAPTDASGQQRGPNIGEAHAYHVEIERLVQAFAGGAAAFPTLAIANSNLTWPAYTMAYVLADSTVANNGIYSKTGASGSGSWTRLSDSFFEIIPLAITSGAAPNTITANSVFPVSTTGKQMFTLVPNANNTGAATLAINGGTAGAIQDMAGSAIGANFLLSGSITLLMRNGSNYQGFLQVDFATAAASVAADRIAAAASAAAAAASAASIDPSLLVSKTGATGVANIPVGTTAQRPGTPAAGQFRFNSSNSIFEGYTGSAWNAIGTGTTINLSGGDAWARIASAVSGGYRWAEIESYSDATVACSSQITLGSNFQLYCQGALFEKAFNGTPFRMGDQSQIHNIKFDGKHATYTGGFFEIVSGNNQRLVNPHMVGASADPALNFKASDEGGADGCGTNFHGDFGLWFAKDASSYSIKGPNIAPATSGYAKFANIAAGGTQCFDFRAARGWQVINGFLGGTAPLLFATNTFNAQIFGGRLAPTGAQNVFGESHVFSKVELGGTYSYVLGSNCSDCIFDLMGYETITDNSGRRNFVQNDGGVVFTPTITVSAGGPVVLGTGGSITGKAWRVGEKLRLQITIVWGTSPTPGTGNYTIGLPSTYSLSSVLSRAAYDGGRMLYLRSTTERKGMHISIAAGASSFIAYVDDAAANYFNYLWPYTVAAGDSQKIEVEYDVGTA